MAAIDLSFSGHLEERRTIFLALVWRRSKQRSRHGDDSPDRVRPPSRPGGRLGPGSREGGCQSCHRGRTVAAIELSFSGHLGEGRALRLALVWRPSRQRSRGPGDFPSRLRRRTTPQRTRGLALHKTEAQRGVREAVRCQVVFDFSQRKIHSSVLSRTTASGFAGDLAGPPPSALERTRGESETSKAAVESAEEGRGALIFKFLL